MSFSPHRRTALARILDKIEVEVDDRLEFNDVRRISSHAVGDATELFNQKAYEILSEVCPELYQCVIQRLDPEGCGCTDCLTGRSVPLDGASELVITLAKLDIISNASCTDL